jgi:hypothetical protein
MGNSIQQGTAEHKMIFLIFTIKAGEGIRPAHCGRIRLSCDRYLGVDRALVVDLLQDGEVARIPSLSDHVEFATHLA